MLQSKAPVEPAHFLIKRLERFTRLSSDDKRALNDAGSQKVRRLQPRDDLVHEGDRPTVVNLFLEGWACRYKTLEDGRRQVIAYFLPGDLCDLNVFILSELDHSIAAITPVRVAEISREAMTELTGDQPRITQALWWSTLVNEAIQREWAVSLGQRSAFERLGHLFCELFTRLRVLGLTDGNACELPLTQADLGDTVGLSTVHVNRTLQELRAQNLIVLERKQLTIPNLDALMQASLFNPNYLHLNHDGRHLDANQ